MYETYDDELKKLNDGDVACCILKGVNKGGISSLRDATSSTQLDG
jgi:hypothetical protein